MQEQVHTTKSDQEAVLRQQYTLHSQDSVKRASFFENEVKIQQVCELPHYISNQESEFESATNQHSKEAKMNKNNIQTINSLKNELVSKIIQHNRNANQALTPSPEQIKRCAQMLQNEFPRLRIDHILQTIDSVFQNKCKMQENLEDQADISEREESSAPTVDYSKANALVRENEAVKVPAEIRLSDEQKIAVSYLNHGYGVRILRQYIKDPSINSTRYNNVITTIMKLSFRKLQEHIKAMGQPVVPVNSQDQKVIRAPLTNCEKWMPPDELQTFYRFIKLACSLQTKIDVSPTTALKLYDSCIRQLQQRQSKEQKMRNQRMMRGRMSRITHSSYNLVDDPGSDLQSMRQSYDTDFYQLNNFKAGLNSTYPSYRTDQIFASRPQTVGLHQFNPKPPRFTLQSASNTNENLKTRNKPFS